MCGNRKKLYDYDVHVLPFTVRAKLAGKEPVVRRLCHDRDNGEFRSLMYSWYKEIEKNLLESGFSGLQAAV